MVNTNTRKCFFLTHGQQVLDVATKHSGCQRCIKVGVPADEGAQYTTSHIQEQVCDAIDHQTPVRNKIKDTWAESEASTYLNKVDRSPEQHAAYHSINRTAHLQERGAKRTVNPATTLKFSDKRSLDFKNRNARTRGNVFTRAVPIISRVSKIHDETNKKNDGGLCFCTTYR